MSNTVKILSELEMVGFLKVNGTACRFVALTCDTEPKLRKDCPFKGVRKVSRKIGLINANYNTSVRRRLAEQTGVSLAEAEYTNGEVWYKHLMTEEGKPLPVVVHATKETGKYYLQYFPHKSTSVYVTAEGSVLDEATLKPYFYKQSERADYKPSVISIDLANVLELKASGIIMQAEDLAEAEAALSQ